MFSLPKASCLIPQRVRNKIVDPCAQMRGIMKRFGNDKNKVGRPTRAIKKVQPMNATLNRLERIIVSMCPISQALCEFVALRICNIRSSETAMSQGI